MLQDHLDKLRAFYVTAREGSFKNATKKLGLTQPAVTKAFSILECVMDASPNFLRHAGCGSAQRNY